MRTVCRGLLVLILFTLVLSFCSARSAWAATRLSLEEMTTIKGGLWAKCTGWSICPDDTCLERYGGFYDYGKGLQHAVCEVAGAYNICFSHSEKCAQMRLFWKRDSNGHCYEPAGLGDEYHYDWACNL